VEDPQPTYFTNLEKKILCSAPSLKLLNLQKFSQKRKQCDTRPPKIHFCPFLFIFGFVLSLAAAPLSPFFPLSLFFHSLGSLPSSS
jgi:hypothetical protein